MDSIMYEKAYKLDTLLENYYLINKKDHKLLKFLKLE